MARGIETCTGQHINIGDRVVTEDGNVITVQGAAIGVKFYNAEKCTPVDPTHKPTPVKPAAASGDSDCIIWGS